MNYTPFSIRMLWFIVAGMPPASGLLELVFRSARSPDEALGIAFILVPLFMAALGIAIVELARTILSTGDRRNHFRIVLKLFIALIPAFFLISANGAFLGWHGRYVSKISLIICACANIGWATYWFWSYQRYSDGSPPASASQ